jgi:hypothetical protein
MRKNGEWIVVDFACVKSLCVGILHNLTDMHRKLSAGLGLHAAMVLVAYQWNVAFTCCLHGCGHYCTPSGCLVW